MIMYPCKKRELVLVNIKMHQKHEKNLEKNPTYVVLLKKHDKPKHMFIFIYKDRE